MKKKVLSLLLVLTMVFALAACGGSEDETSNGNTTGGSTNNATGSEDTGDSSSEDEEIVIGFVVKSLADQHWNIVKAGAEAKAEELGVDLVFIAPNAESDVQAQVTMLEDLVAQEVDALCVAPNSPDAVIPVFEKATEAGIPILAVDTDTKFEEKLSFIGTGNEAAGKAGAIYAAKQVGEGAKAIVLRGRLGDKTHDDREAGIVAGLEENGVEVLEIKAADSEAEKAMNVTQDLINRYDEIDLIITTSDSMAQGAQRSVEAAGADIAVMGFDGTIPVSEMTAEGKFLGTTAQSPYNMGYLGVENAVKAAKGESVDARIDTGSEVVTPENAQDFLDNINSLLGN